MKRPSIFPKGEEMRNRITWWNSSKVHNLVYYTITRLRIKKQAFITPQQYRLLLTMSIPECLHFLSEHGYDHEFLLLPHQCLDPESIEERLNQNLTRSLHSVRKLTSGSLAVLTSLYLQRWDIVNVISLFIRRGQSQNEISKKDLFIPVGDIDSRRLSSLASLRSSTSLLDGLSFWPLSPILADEIQKSANIHLFTHLEHRLYQEYYRSLLHFCEQNHLSDSALFLEILRKEIDLLNMKTLIRILMSGERAPSPSPFLEGGNLHGKILTSCHDEKSLHDLISLSGLSSPMPHRVTQNKGARDHTINYWNEASPSVTLERALLHSYLEWCDHLSRRYPLSIFQVIHYIERKRYEITNLTALLLGKSSGLRSDEIQETLMI